MGLKKCPRCELNYILQEGDLCSVCREELRGVRAREETVVICSACGEMPAVAGEDMCRACLKEMRSMEILITDEEERGSAESTELDPNLVSGLDEIETAGVMGKEALDEDDEALGLDEEETAEIRHGA